MTTHHALGFGPRLIVSPTGRLRAAILVKPAPAIEAGKALPGDPGAVYARAVEQHDALCKTLQNFGVETIVLDARGPDPCEVAAADAAIAFEDGAAMMRLSAMSRRAEVDRMEAEFSQIDIPLAGHVTAPGLLDGTDVMFVGETAFIGVGVRGNELGRKGFAQLARSHGYRVVEVKLAAGVSALRCVAGAASSDSVILGADKLDATAFDGFKTVILERGEEQAAGVLCIEDGRVLADIRYRTAIPAMRRAGIAVESIDLYEFGKLGLTPSMLALALKRE
jgi:dimethylargininase